MLFQQIISLKEELIVDKKEFMTTFESMLDKYVEENKQEIEIPNDKIVLSADIFSKIVNIISYCESQNVIDPFLQDMFDDVKQNRTMLSRKKKEEKKAVPKIDWSKAKWPPEGTVDLLDTLFPQLRIAEHPSK